MTNLDLLKQNRAGIRTALADAIKNNDAEGIAKSMSDLSEDVLSTLMLEHQRGANDATVLLARGARQLTSAEKSYYEKVADAMRQKDAASALAGIEEVLPKTVYDEVFEELQREHPLLGAIDFVNTSGITEWPINTHEVQMAQWGPLTGAITKELSSGFERLNMTQYKLSAFFPVPKSTLDLGPEWLDRYIRTILAEALAVGMEEGIVNGTGKEMPIGITREVGPDVTIVGGVYPLRPKVGIESFSPAEYGALIANNLATTAHGAPRVISSLAMLVNPWDYYAKIMPATTGLTPQMTYARDILPVPTTVIQSERVTRGEAVLSIPHRYFMGMGLPSDGRIEYDDSYRFLEDERVYLIKTYGNGRPKDNFSAVRLDITALRPARYEVYMSSASATSDTPAAPTPDTTLESLSLGSLELTPAFSADVTEYSAETANTTNKITVSAKSSTATVSITHGETVVANGGSITWADGENVVEITVVDGGKAQTYTVTVTKTATSA